VLEASFGTSTIKQQRETILFKNLDIYLEQWTGNPGWQTLSPKLPHDQLCFGRETPSHPPRRRDIITMRLLPSEDQQKLLTSSAKAGDVIGTTALR